MRYLALNPRRYTPRMFPARRSLPTESHAVLSCIAVVDENPAMRVALSRVLRAAGYGVDLFSSEEAFLRSLTSKRPECVILDVHVPASSGLDVAYRVAANHPSLPVIAMTGYVQEDLEKAVARCGARALLKKPFSDEELFIAIEAAIPFVTSAH